MPPIGPALPRPHDIEDRDAIELLDETETWNAAIEHVAVHATLAYAPMVVYVYDGNGKLKATQPCKDLPAVIRSFKRPVTP